MSAPFLSSAAVSHSLGRERQFRMLRDISVGGFLQFLRHFAPVAWQRDKAIKAPCVNSNSSIGHEAIL